MEYNLRIRSSKSERLTYESAIAEIEALEARGWRLGLDRMAAFCTHAGLDGYLGGSGKPRYIHIAGTNGKGSTNAFVEAIFRSAGFKTGAFYSPYVKDYRERIQAEGRLIGKDELADLTDRLFRDAETFAASDFGGITKFEFEAALGFKYWGEAGCEWVGLEVGLGGRLDATNVVQPACSIIVSIGLDHTSILGGTLSQIAGEKAGIVKPEVPVIIGQMPDEAREAIEARAAALNCEVWRFGQEIRLEMEGDVCSVTTPGHVYAGLVPGLTGKMQPHNMALAVAAADRVGVSVSLAQVQTGVALATAPGRFEEHIDLGVRLVVDGAHNPDAAQKLVHTLKSRYADVQPWVLLANTLSGHDSEAFYKVLGGEFAHIVIPPIASPRALSPEAAQDIAKNYFPHTTLCHDVRGAVTESERLATRHGLVVVTGSNYLAGEVLNLLDRRAISAP